MIVYAQCVHNKINVIGCCGVVDACMGLHYQLTVHVAERL